jgi:hypothetical protein
MHLLKATKNGFPVRTAAGGQKQRNRPRNVSLQGHPGFSSIFFRRYSRSWSLQDVPKSVPFFYHFTIRIFEKNVPRFSRGRFFHEGSYPAKLG